MKLKTKELFGCLILLLATFLIWEFTKPMTLPKAAEKVRENLRGQKI
jgi:predicted small integral membrane protein